MKKKSLNDASILLGLILMLILSSCARLSLPDTGWLPVSRTQPVSFDNATYDVEIWASASCVKWGDTLHVRGTLTNKISKTRVFQVKDKPVFDIVVAFGGAKTYWSDGEALTTDLTRLELKPSESRILEMDRVVTGTVVYGDAGAIFTYGDRPGDYGGISVPISLACPGFIGP